MQLHAKTNISRTILAKVDNMAAEQDHEGVKEVEAVGCRGMNRRADSDAVLDQPFHNCHHLVQTHEQSQATLLGCGTCCT